MISRAHPSFWKHYNDLPADIQAAARRAYRLFQRNPYHASLQFKLAQGRKNLYSVRIGLRHRALGEITAENEITWFWIGTHAEYDTLLK